MNKYEEIFATILRESFCPSLEMLSDRAFVEERTMKKLNEKMIEIHNPYPVKMEEIIELVEHSTRLIYTTTDSKTIQLYIYSTGRDRPDYLAEVEITSTGYILHDNDGFYYQGSTFKEFQNDLREVVFSF